MESESGLHNRVRDDGLSVRESTSQYESGADAQPDLRDEQLRLRLQQLRYANSALVDCPPVRLHRRNEQLEIAREKTLSHLFILGVSTREEEDKFEVVLPQ